MPGLPQVNALQLSAWLQGQLTAGDLHNDLVDTLTNCRAVVACKVLGSAKLSDNPSVISDDIVR